MSREQVLACAARLLDRWEDLGSITEGKLADIVAVQGAVMLIVVMFLVVNLLVDILYAVIDPRPMAAS